ncbi:hypothetical protein G6F65_015961 [Rhizopus arrhizus]|nr:hypothetical protein G6F65_015961 [Rhizopus arrhizus]
MKPTGAPSWPIIEYQPRRLGGAFSASNDGNPSHDPPNANPCKQRNTASKQEQRDSQLCGAAPTPLDRHRQRGADGTHDEREREDDEGPERAFQLRFEGEEDLRKNQHAGDAEYKEIEVFRGASHHHADGDFTRGHLGVAGPAGRWPRAGHSGGMTGILRGGRHGFAHCRRSEIRHCPAHFCSFYPRFFAASSVVLRLPPTVTFRGMAMPSFTRLRGLILIAALPLLAGCNAVLLSPSGDVALQQRNLIIISTGLMLLIIVPVIFLTFLFAWRYRASNRQAHYDPEWNHSTMLELLIWAAPLLIIIALGALTWVSTHQLDPYRPLARLSEGREVPAGTKPLVVEVVALDWKWLFLYPEQGIATVNEMAAPVDRPIQFKITSRRCTR